jgi:hypothetical protein
MNAVEVGQKGDEMPPRDGFCINDRTLDCRPV